MKNIDLEALLRRHRLKITEGRIEVLKLLSLSKAPLSVEQIVKKSKKIDRANVYRNVEIFLKEGIVREVPLHHSHQHIEFNLPKTNHHHHIICRKCSSVEEVSSCGLNSNLEKKILKNSTMFKTLDDHSLDFYGLCKLCARIKK